MIRGFHKSGARSARRNTMISNVFSFWTPEQGASLLDQACRGLAGQARAQSLAQYLDPKGQAVADFLQWHLTGIPQAKVTFHGEAHQQGTQWKVRVNGNEAMIQHVRAWVDAQAVFKPLTEWGLVA